jgi:hypothetical protein
MKWSKEKPIKPGYYWHYRKDFFNPLHIFEIKISSDYRDGGQLVVCEGEFETVLSKENEYTGYWFGPLEVPGLPNESN